MNKTQILVVEDDSPIRNLITTTLKTNNYRYLTAVNGESAISQTASHNPDIILLDLGLPDIDGVEVIKKIRTWTNTPIIVISARTEDADKIEALDAGADDYLTKPFRLTTLLMRVKSLLRRMDMNTKKVTGQELSDIKIGNLRFSAQENCLYCKGKPVSLSKTELKMLTYMLKEPKKAFSREEILEGVWGFDTEVETRVTDETLRRIRRKLSLAGSNVSIGTIWGFGYRISIAEDKK